MSIRSTTLTAYEDCREAFRSALRRAGEGGCVVTPNLDHAVCLGRDADLRGAYDRAALVLADGMSLVLASRLGGTHLPGRVAGSDLILPLCAAAAIVVSADRCWRLSCRRSDVRRLIAAILDDLDHSRGSACAQPA